MMQLLRFRLKIESDGSDLCYFSQQNMFGFIAPLGRLPAEFKQGKDVFFHFNVAINLTQVTKKIL
jgi:cold shock CspA family protein